MESDIEFLFQNLTPATKRHIRLFQLHQFLDRFAMGLTVSVVALALVDRGMDLFQISLLFGAYSVTTLTMELPFGGLADNIGRKPVFLAAVVASLISLALFLSSSNFYVLALSFAFIGFGRALRSGTLDAWFIEHFKAKAQNVDVQPALAKAQWANGMGLAFGAIIGGWLPDAFGAIAVQYGFSAYDLAYAASFAMMTAVLIYTLFAIVEEPRPLHPKALVQGFANVPVAVRDAGLLAMRHPTLSLLLAALALLLMATNPVEVLWPTHVKPMLEEGYANTVIGLLTAACFFSIAIGASLSPHINRVFRRQNAMTLTAAVGCLAVLQIALALQGGVVGFVIVLIIYFVILGVGETPASSILHSSVENHQRSTMLSLRSLVQQLGATFGLILVGAIAEGYSTPIGWMVGALFTLGAVLLTGLLATRLKHRL
ncbi:MFS transporter [uncultured Tateyamaria sp.]|uniref:MFS transporter n=1 Tax=uncultured Tateyamaria sp. TaxID=455651 RepID=UPI00260FF356|nr:MFS transporter [uncultured Tateyamaria sp.]